MISPDTFYDLPLSEQRTLVANDRVVQDREIVNEIPDRGEPVRVFEQPISELLAETLQRGQYTIDSLCEEFQLSTSDVRERIYRLRDNPVESLQEHHAVLRVRGEEGASYIYTLESIPFHARIVDPTLGFSLLKLIANAADIPDGVTYEAGESGTYDEAYLDTICEYWGVERDEATEYLEQFDRNYISSCLGPLPLVQTPEREQRVRDRLASAEEAYARKRYDADTVQKRLSKWEQQCRYDPSIPVFEAAAIELFDIKQYAKTQNEHSLARTVEDRADTFLDWLQLGELSKIPSSGQETSEGQGEVTDEQPTPAQSVLSERARADLTEAAQDALRSLVQLGEASPSALQEEWQLDRYEDVETYLSVLDDYHSVREDGVIVPNTLATKQADGTPESSPDIPDNENDPASDSVASRIDQLSTKERSRLRDITELQPTKDAELIDKWNLKTDSNLRQYFEHHLSDLCYLDDRERIRAIEGVESALPAVEEQAPSTAQDEADDVHRTDTSSDSELGTSSTSNDVTEQESNESSSNESTTPDRTQSTSSASPSHEDETQESSADTQDQSLLSRLLPRLLRRWK